jgi:hypothetical protein
MGGKGDECNGSAGRKAENTGAKAAKNIEIADRQSRITVY